MTFARLRGSSTWADAAGVALAIVVALYPQRSAHSQASSSGVTTSALPSELRDLEEACDRGVAPACVELGTAYAAGNGVAQDELRASRLFSKACSEGDAVACVELGVLYEEGRGVARDRAHAAELYETACEGGSAPGCFRFGLALDPSALDASSESVVETPDSAWQRKREERKSAYSRVPGGRLWIEAFAGPSLYDPDRRTDGLNIGGSSVNVPISKGPEFGALIGGAIDSGFVLGGFYRQANYEGFKLMKAGLELQVSFRIPYVDWISRGSFGYVRTFDGSPFPSSTSNNNGFSGAFGTGIRVPIVRWISLVASIDFNWTRLYVSEDLFGGARSVRGLQLIGTFGVTLHFIGA